MSFQYYPVARMGESVLFYRVGKPEGRDFVKYPKYSPVTTSDNALTVTNNGVYPASFLSLVTREYQDWEPIKGNKLAELIFSFRTNASEKDNSEFQKAVYDQDVDVLNKYANSSQQDWTATPAMLGFLDEMREWGLPLPGNAPGRKSSAKPPRKIKRTETV